jgi:hypothetical protein
MAAKKMASKAPAKKMASKAPAKKMASKPAVKKQVTDTQAKQMLNDALTGMMAEGKGIRDFPKAQDLINAIGDSFDPGGAFVTKIGRNRFERLADAEARKVHARIKKAASRGDMNRSASNPWYLSYKKK